MTAPLPPDTAVLLTPHRAGLAAAADNTVEVLVRIQAPDAPADRPVRPPMALSLVVDCSGSMAGRPLHEARRCAARVIACLRPDDTVSIVAFDHRATCVWPAVPRGDGTGATAALARLQDGGNTDLHGGWREGARSLADLGTQQAAGVRRMMLLSDGAANEGVTDPQAIAAAVAQTTAQGVTTSTYGLGPHFNEDLMQAIARAGGGQGYYGETAEDLMEPFQEEMGLLGDLCLRDLRLQVQPVQGVQATLLNDLPPDDGGWRLPDLAWGAEAWAVVRLAVPAALVPATGMKLPLLRVSVTGRDPSGEPVTLERTGLALTVMAEAEVQALAADELVGRRLVELAAADALAEVRRLAADDEWESVDRLLADAKSRFEGNAWVAASITAMEAIARDRDRVRFSKKAAYASSKLNSRLAAKMEAMSSDAMEDDAQPLYLRRRAEPGKGS